MLPANAMHKRSHSLSRTRRLGTTFVVVGRKTPKPFFRRNPSFVEALVNEHASVDLLGYHLILFYTFNLINGIIGVYCARINGISMLCK